MSSKKNSKDFIVLTQVGTNNLKNIDVKIPIKKFTVVTGVSGSGKSSLVFDTLYAESYRRYVESLSSYARQFIKALPKPKVSSVENLPPSIAVKQSRSGANNRSTVGTLTELTDLIRMIFTHLSLVICNNCKRVVQQDTPETVFAQLAQNPTLLSSSPKIMILFPLKSWDTLNSKDLLDQLKAQGFTRIYAKEEVIHLAEIKHDKLDLLNSWVVVDRMEFSLENKKRFIESAILAFKAGRGRIGVQNIAARIEAFTTSFECCGTIYHKPSVELFSFNHPLGACKVCQGFGQESQLDWRKIIPDESLSLGNKGIHAWNFGQHVEMYGIAFKEGEKKFPGIKKKQFSDYSQNEWAWLKTGSFDFGMKTSKTNFSKADFAKVDFAKVDFDGIEGYFKWLDSQRYKAHYRIHASRFRKYVLCTSCGGARLNQMALACRLSGMTIAQANDLSVKFLKSWLLTVESTFGMHGNDHSEGIQIQTPEERKNLIENGDQNLSQNMLGVHEAVVEAQLRIDYLLKMGLSYLTLNRSSKTLSGGELQRINMSRCLGGALTETLFCLDEPTSGLHARDSENILGVLKEIRNLGNTVVTVEHDRQIILGSDHLIEIGPEAGHKGGYIVYEGAAESKPSKKDTGELSQKGAAITKNCDHSIELKGVETNNLKKISVKFPLGTFIGVCGVSGSGKTSLIQHTLYPALLQILKKEDAPDEALKIESIGPQTALMKLKDVMLVSQAPIGRSSRSNIATYLGVFDEIRKLFANQELAKKIGLSPGAFSFNTPGGRCETCRGLGLVTEDLSFLGEMNVICPSCSGKRFDDKVLSVTFKGKNLIEVLNFTVEEARVFFVDQKQMVKAFEVICSLRLGYMTLGQNTSSFSGGEAQRLKMVELLREVPSKMKSPKKSAKDLLSGVLIFDEPTTGLSDLDVQFLILQFRRLRELGHTVIVVEHHLDILRSCDWLIEIGPEASEEGGQLVYQGHPEGLKKVKESRTAKYLQ